MLALRSVLLPDALDEAALSAAAQSAADAVAIDLGGPSVHGRREEARAAAVRHAQAIAQSGRPVCVRLADTRSGEMEADVEAVAGEWLAAVILSGTEVPQDVRDVDVQLRKREMRRGMAPGAIRLIPELDSAEGLLRLSKIVAAVDRHSGIALNIDGLRADLHLGARATTLYEHAMADLAVAAHAVRLPWLLSSTVAPDLATAAHELGAAGVIVRDEGAVRGINALFSLDPADVSVARAVVEEWERLRASGAAAGMVTGEQPGSARLVDRRTVRRARALLAQAEAIERRERLG